MGEEGKVSIAARSILLLRNGLELGQCSAGALPGSSYAVGFETGRQRGALIGLWVHSLAHLRLPALHPEATPNLARAKATSPVQPDGRTSLLDHLRRPCRSRPPNRQ